MTKVGSVVALGSPINFHATDKCVRTHTRAEVLHIGYPKAASTFLVKYLVNHPQVTVDQFQLSDLLHQVGRRFDVREKPSLHKVHVSKDENVAESVCVIGNLNNWQRYTYVPGAWDRV